MRKKRSLGEEVETSRPPIKKKKLGKTQSVSDVVEIAKPSMREVDTTEKQGSQGLKKKKKKMLDRGSAKANDDATQTGQKGINGKPLGHSEGNQGEFSSVLTTVVKKVCHMGPVALDSLRFVHRFRGSSRLHCGIFQGRLFFSGCARRCLDRAEPWASYMHGL